MAAINDLIAQVENPELRARLEQEVARLNKQKKFGLVFEEHMPECTPLYEMPIRRGSHVALRAQQNIEKVYTVLAINEEHALCFCEADKEQVEFALSDLVVVAQFGEPIYPYLKPLDSVCNAPDSDLWHTLIEADNYHALQLLEYLYAGQVDCIYIDPPYNSGAKDWKYNNDYVDGNDSYKHSKWLSMMQKRLRIAKKLLNPKDSVLIVTIDEKEYLHLGCLLEEMFPDARIQMISDVINPKGVARSGFRRNDEYIFFVMIGDSMPARIALSAEWSSSATLANAQNSNSNSITPEWTSMMRRGSHSSRQERPGLYYPIYVSAETKTIKVIGTPLPAGQHDGDEIDGLVQVLPIRTNGEEGCWQVGPDELRNRIDQGRVRLGRETSYGYVINYLPDGAYQELLTASWVIDGRAADGSLIAHYVGDDSDTDMIAPTQWKIASHNASENGSSLIQKILCNKRFAFPKSLYSEMDTLRFFVANKPNALIVDFFAGSGTTLHAVNLLNAEDDGHRRCILVTNNEVSVEEAKTLKTKGHYPGSEEWNKLGIARYVTWPRTVCSIMGRDVKGIPLAGDYGIEIETYEPDDEVAVVSTTTGKPIRKTVYRKTKKQAYPKLAELSKGNGLKANAVFFKLGFLDKTSVALGRQFRELLPVLWMKAGAIGPCPQLGEAELPQALILPENHFAVLLDETAFTCFVEDLKQHPQVETVYIITDYEAGYRNMAEALHDKQCWQLYRSYLDNFRINQGRA